VRRIAPGRYLVDGTLRPAEVERACGVPLPEGDYETVGGLVMDRLARIPVVGDRVAGEEWSLTVRTMDGRRVGRVELATGPRPTGEEGTGPSPRDPA
jgi:CBS domain containing-hemolysin-like protein